MIQKTRQISPKLKEIIIDENYRNKIDGVLATLSAEEKKQLITLASKKTE